MIQVGTNLDITDNSGARVVKCVKVLDKTKQSNGYPGTVCVVSVKTLVRKQKSKVKKGHLYKAVVCETKKMGGRADGSQMSCSRNTAILLSPQQTPLGSRIQGITPYELRMKKHPLLSQLQIIQPS